MDKETKIKCNYHLQLQTREIIEHLHKSLGISRGSVIDLLAQNYSTKLKKGEAHDVRMDAVAYFCER